MSEQGYRPGDQDEKLGPPPWKPDDPAVIAWERYHGHDPRLSCYLDGCGVLQRIAAEEHEELMVLRDEVRRLPLTQLRATGGQEVGLKVVAAILAQYDFPAIAAILRAAEAARDEEG